MKNELNQLEFYAVRNREGQWFHRKGYSGYGETWVEDVEQARKLPPHARRDPILVGDVIHTELSEGGHQSGLAPVIPDLPQRLRKVGLSAPDRDIEWSRIVPVKASDNPV